MSSAPANSIVEDLEAAWVESGVRSQMSEIRDPEAAKPLGTGEESAYEFASGLR